MSEPRIRVLCVDDHPIVRQGIALILKGQDDIDVVALAGGGDEAIEFHRRYRPDVTLMDLQLGKVSGLEAIRAIRRDCPDARIIVLTMYRGDEDIYRAIEAGAVTYLLKDMLADDLLDMIRSVHAGERPMQPDVAARLAARSDDARLSQREVEILEHVFRGMRNKEVALSLGISEDTVEAHLKKIFAKLKVNDRTAALNVALHRGIIHLQ